MCCNVYSFAGIQKKNGRLIMPTGTSFFSNAQGNQAKSVKSWAIQNGFVEDDRNDDTEGPAKKHKTK